LNTYLPSNLNETEPSSDYIIRTAMERFADYLESHKANLDEAFASKLNNTKSIFNETNSVTQVKEQGKRL